ncbi:ABC transporter ATP-binding protein [Intrasporangium sp.]|uniref:ABC transporter ATP-binding protein n=1 Tax=Intrasporangium sp. TaxID=1925024 RepID=UPI0029395873|nr:ATP-binding cassette domain-containing protein [Intrasporangium sp.]MDV3220106.1 ATP-binding cassette domain-containing protein [Intrasporangium sp.]
MTDAIEISGLTHRFGERVVVADLTLSVARGESFGLLGPNGAGKTTTIRLLNTLLPVQKGEIAVFGRSVRSEPMAVRRVLGYVPQQLSIETALTGRENVEWFARLYDVPRRELRARVDEALAMVDLQSEAHRRASTYSGGMLRRLELAQALVNRPALLVLDEPTLGLDPVARDSIWQRVLQMQHDLGTTVLLTTHYMEEADTLCDRVGLMHVGRLQAIGTPSDLKRGWGPGSSLEDVFRHYTGAALAQKEGTNDVRPAARRGARRLG